MTERVSRQIVLAARPHGSVQLSDFRVEETMVPVPGVGQILLAVQYLSLDPYMRGRMDDRKSYAKPVQIGEVMVGGERGHCDRVKSFRLCRGRHSGRANWMAYTLAVGGQGPSQARRRAGSGYNGSGCARHA